MKNKTNLITIIGSKQTKYSKIILEDKSLSDFNICTQNYLHSSNVDFDKEVNNNLILIVYSPEDELDSIKNIEKLLQNCTCRVNNIPTFILVEDNVNEDIEDIMTVFAVHGFTPEVWGGDNDFIEESELLNSLYYHYTK